ncbi:unnamed protein product [Pocillopora meandrina]|uniref:Ephrin RBD domain-containing protein n=1 Tax=Pocillopora meandrina TaxID=46732 RepID=A0AAU9WB95_9CNID|nr:unnamed protein product [Pocillopora meandrina]
MPRRTYSFLLLLAQIVALFDVLKGAVYPSIHWSPQNPLFGNGDSVLNVLPMSKLHIVCPNPSTVLKKVRDNTPKDKLYENVWIVSRDNYDSCSTDSSKGSRLLQRCTTPLALKYYTLVFQRFSAVSSQVFNPGREYYISATSDGTQGSIDSRSGGNCKHNKMKLRIYVCKNTKDPRCNRKPTTTATKAPTTSTTTLKSTIPSTTTSSTTTFQTTNSTTTNAPTEKVTLSTRTTGTSESSTRTKAAEKPATTTDASVVGHPVNAELSSPIKPEYVHKHHSHVRSDQCYICSVSELNWTIMIPLMACLLLSIMVNIILFCRLKKRKQGYDLEERKPKMIEATSVKRQEKDRIEPRVERTWLLCRRSADVTDV